ncbi:MAG: SurA N-terminal domain-containing protein [Desulfobacterales bacterium]|jgi:peptidyl-prolyl cis-trans isomerase D
MLRLMRDYATSWMIKFILGAIVLVFIFWGVGSFDAGKAGKVAVVNDRVITAEEYREAYDNLVERMRASFGGSLNEDMLKALNVRKQALDQLINETLLVQEAETLGFRVTDDELASAIRNIPAFQRAGVFDNRLYQNVLGRYRMSPEEFETSQRSAMLAEKVRTFVTGTVQVSDDEALTWYKWQNAEVSLDFVHFSPAAYKDVKASEEEVKSRFDKKPEAYKTQEEVKVRYIRFAPEDYLSSVNVTPEQVRQYYDANPEEFTSPKTVEARHILFKLDPNADQETVEAKRQKAMEVLKMAQSGKDFAELARQFSEGPSAQQGGYLGAFKKEDMVAPFSEKAFSMKPGEVAGPVRTRFGWHLIKVEKVNEAAKKTLEEASDQIRREIALSDARTLAYDQAGAVYDVSFEGDDLVKAAQERDLHLITTGFFTRSGPKEGVQNRAEFAKAAFDLNPMEISDVKEFSDGYYLLQVLDKKPSKIPEFEAVADEVRADVIRDKKNQKAEEDAKAFLEAVRSDPESMGKKALAAGRPMQSTGFFKRNGQIPQIGYAQEISSAAFLLTQKSPFAEQPLNGPIGYYVIRLQERREPTIDGFKEQKPAIEQTLRRQKEQRAFAEWLEWVKAKSEISIEQDFVE